MNDVDRILPQSASYIRRWQYKRALEVDTCQLTRFRRIPIGKCFTLPGGNCEQIRLSKTLALAGDRIVSYKGWERVVAL